MTQKAVKGERPTIEYDGIEVHLSAEDFDDYEITECIADIEDDSSDESTKTASIVRMMRLILKDDYQSVKNELKARGGGRVSNKAMIDFAFGVMEKAGAKNS